MRAPKDKPQHAHTAEKPADLPWTAAVAEALAHRRTHLPFDDARTNIFRLIHAHADRMPGVIVDRLGHVANIRLRPERLEAGVPEPAWWLEALAPAGITHAWLTLDAPRKDLALDDESRGAAALDAWREALAAADALAPERWTASELGLRYELSSVDGYSYGIFTDMRPVRAALRERWEGRRVANLFAYTGAFAVALAEQNEVTNVDVSRVYLEHAERNLALNALEGRVRHTRADAFDFLERAVKRGTLWDALILDPPVFSHGKKGLSRRFSLERDLDALLELALAALAPGGELMFSTNLASMHQAAFDRVLRDAAPRFGAAVTQRFGPAADYPVEADAWHLKAALLTKR